MNREDYQQVKKIFQSALDLESGERDAFLDAACPDNKDLRLEVEKLLNSVDSGYLERPAIETVAEAIIGSNLSIGQEIGHYKIVKKIGAGGMGEVFLAEDGRLRRKIALKILPVAFSQDKNYLRRFEQEACAASALNHPNILTVHEFGGEAGMNFIASEFVEGETLRERLCGDVALNLSETLDIVLQVAAALHAAHSSGIIHRDIKPENIMIRKADGLVKVLDFGLAKLTFEKNHAVAADDVTQFHTMPGVVMGTAAYMSPEQARGLPTDARTDIWSLGVVLYEMQAGKTPFKGETTSDTIASILMREPAPVDKNIPVELARILRKALHKECDERYQTTKEFLLDLGAMKRTLESPTRLDGDNVHLAEETTPDQVSGDVPATGTMSAPGDERGSGIVPSVQARWGRPVTILLAAFAALVVVGSLFWWQGALRTRNQASTNLLASLRMKSLVSWDGEAGESEAGARFSPNGTMIAYSLTKNGQRNIWTKQVPDGKPNPITDGKWNYFNPIWSADGQRIAFVSNRDNQLAIWAMPFSGGELTPISAIEGGSVTLLQWSKNGGTIYFQQGYNFFGLDIASRQISQLTHFDEINQAQFFSLSPNEDRIAYSAGPNEQLRLFVMDLKGRQSVQITNDDASDEYPFWLPDGERIIYSSKRDGIFQTCIAYLNENRREQLNLGITDTLISDVASGGDKILFRQSREESDLWQVTIDSKSETQITTDSGLELWSDASSDGKNIVFQATTESKHLFGGSIVIRSTDDNQQINITSNGFSPTYSPDGRRVAFLRYADNHVNIWAASRTGADERQLTTDGIRFSGFTFMPYNRVQIKDYSWSPDGNSLIYSAKRSGVWNVWLVRADGTGEPRQLTQNSDETVQVSCPLFAPDGKRIAYTVGPLRPTSESETTIKLANVDGGDGETLFTSGSLFRLLCWERSGKGLLIAMSDDRSSAKPTRVKLVHIAPGNSRTELAVVAATYFNNIQFSPDGKKIAYAAHENGKDNIKVISTSGGESTTTLATADPNVYVSGLAWSPDSKTVYYGKQKKIRTISMIENFK